MKGWLWGSQESLVRAEQVRALDRSAPAILIVMLPTSILVTVSLWGFVPNGRLIPWFVCAFTAQIFRFLLSRWYRRETPYPENAVWWERLFVLGSLLVGIVWGSAGWLLFPAGEPGRQAFLTMVLLGLAAGSLTSGTAVLAVTYCVAIPLIIPIAIRTAMEGSVIAVGTGVLAGAYLLFVLYTGRIINRTFLESLQMRFELQIAKQTAEAANEAKTRFLASASHDLRQPLHALGLLVSILRQPMDANERREIIDKIQSSIGATEALFNGILDISKLDAGVIRPNVESFRLRALFENIRTSYSALFLESGLTLAILPTSVRISSDPVILDRILRNLVANSIRYTREGRILLGCRRRGKSEIAIEVWDTGIGIAPENQQKIFEEFVQLANPERDREKGLGLGLSIVKRSAALLNHNIELRSYPGKGSCFRIVVPREQNYIEQDTAPENVTVAEGQSLRGNFILVIDDEADIRFPMEKLLKHWGAQVICASSSVDALAQLTHHLRSPDLVICDLRLRDRESGISAIISVRAATQKAMPALMITGDIGAKDLSEVSAAGIPLLHKPLGSDELYRVISETLAKASTFATH